jgi:hypothetical protein
VAGVVSVTVFSAVHYLLISNIWDMLGVMAVAGALSGLCLTWTYGRLADHPSVAGWIRYNLTYVVGFAFVPALSVVMFEPVMTFAEAAESDGPLDGLILEALPMTIAVTVAIAVFVSWRYGTLRRDFGPVLITVVVLMLFLGLNLTIIGLVEFSGGRLRIVGGFIGLILVVGFVFVVTFLGLERKRLRPAETDSDDRP